MTAEGRRIGTVDALLIDRKTRQLRYVILDEKASRASGTNGGKTAAIAIPWQALYFDSAMARLVFYTYS